MRKFELVIAGGGLTAARAIRSYRETGGDGPVALVSQEAVLPYHRPALSKRFLRGETSEPPFAEHPGFYREHDVEVLLETRVTSVEPADRIVTAGGEPLHYDKLLIATGATPRRLRVPGADLDGVFALRTLEDSERIRHAAGTAERAVVVGGGFIGMEAAASLRRLGLDVTLIHLGGGLFDGLGSAELSEQLLGLYREHGVDVMLELEVARIGGEGRVEYVEARTGICVAAELVVVGAGVTPNVELLEGSGIELYDGVAVDEHFETSAAAVYAAGDVANFFDPLYGRRRRIEHWSNASYQGTEVGRALAGAEGRYDTVSSFSSEVFDVTVEVLGDVGRFDEVTTDGTLESGLLASYGESGRLVGAVVVGQPDGVAAHARELIAARAPTSALQDEVVAACGAR
jgi:NADPH-dependent 2,4-dienoyl-CoA reductase/sulfur reductase-like enzyme